MPITLTQSAAARVRDHLQSHHDSEGLRLSVKTSGCSGLAYELDYAKKTANADEVFESHGVKFSWSRSIWNFYKAPKLIMCKKVCRRLFISKIQT